MRKYALSFLMMACCQVAVSKPRKDYCRLCHKTYKVSNNSREGRYNIFSKPSGKPSISERLSAVNVILATASSSLSDSICRGCETKVKKLEDVHSIKEIWASNNSIKRKAEQPIVASVCDAKKQKPSNFDDTNLHQRVSRKT